MAYESVASRFDDATTAMIHALADYGHYAQPILASTNGWTIGKDYAEMDVYYTRDLDIATAAQAVSGYSAKVDTPFPDILEQANYTLNLLSRTEMRALFNTTMTGWLRMVELSGDYQIRYELDGNSVACVYQPDGRYCVSISSIPAHQLGNTHTIAIKETTQGIDMARYTFSPLSYVNGLIRQNDRACQEVAAALYYYYKAVTEYRAAHGY